MVTTHKQINQLLNDVYSNKEDRAIMDEFLKLIKNKKLDYYDINIWRVPHRYLDSLVSHSLFLDEMAKSNNESLYLALIKQGAKSEYYEEWKDSDNSYIRKALAQNGYFIEQYLDDSDNCVRMAALKHSPEYLPYYFKDNTLFSHIYDHYILDPNLNLSEFEMFVKVNARKIAKNEIASTVKLKDIIAIKHQSSKTPTTIEKTMTPTQLYDSGSPIWALNLSLSSIWDVKYAELRNKSKEEIHNRINFPEKLRF